MRSLTKHYRPHRAHAGTHEKAPTRAFRHRTVAAIAGAALAGGLVGGLFATNKGNTAPSKAPTTTSAQATNNMLHAIENWGAQEKKAEQASELDQAVHDMANSAATRIIRMAAFSPDVRLDGGGKQTGEDMYAWDNNYKHPETEVQVWRNQLTVLSIDMPEGSDTKDWNGVTVKYRIPDPLQGEFNHRMTKQDWKDVDPAQLQFESMTVQHGPGLEGSRGNTLLRTEHGYNLDGSPITSPDDDRMISFNSDASRVLFNLTQAQAQNFEPPQVEVV